MDKLIKSADELRPYARHYSPRALFEKIGRVARKAGAKVVYAALVLYYAMFDKGLPVKDRIMVVAALGYFIVPLDLIPDALPFGFSDDAAAMFFLVRHIWKNLSPSTIEKAKARLAEWFGPLDERDTQIVGASGGEKTE